MRNCAVKGIKILYLGRDTGFTGGIERCAWETARLIRAHGGRVDWYGTAPGRGEELFRNGFDAVLESVPSAGAAPEYDLAILHKLCAPEVLNSWRKLFGERLVFLAHDHDVYCPRRHYYTPFGRKNCHRKYCGLRCGICSRITRPAQWRRLGRNPGALISELREHHAAVLSEFMRGNLLRNGFREERLHILPPVIPVREEMTKSRRDEVFHLLFLGQLIRGKGVDLMLEALKRLRTPWRATIAGDGADRPMLEAAAAKYGISDRIEFTGWLTDPEPCFKECDAAIFPSRWQEPFGLSGAEALAHGLPVAAFDTGGVREWLVDGVDGFAVPELDVSALAEKIEILARDRKLAAGMGAAGREIVRERFSPGNFLAALETLLEETGGRR